MPNVFATPDDCNSKLGKRMQQWRADRPDEWLMDEFIRGAEKLSSQLDEALDMLDTPARNHLLEKWGDS